MTRKIRKLERRIKQIEGRIDQIEKDVQDITFSLRELLTWKRNQASRQLLPDTQEIVARVQEKEPLEDE